MLSIHNHGPLITSTDYWESQLAGAGKVFCSVNAGAIRILLPPSAYTFLADMRPARYCILSRGPWPAESAQDAIEILFEDDSDAPFALHLTAASFDVLPAAPDPGRGWVVSAWISKDGRPHKALEKLCHWRQAPYLPCLKPWRPPPA